MTDEEWLKKYHQIINPITGTNFFHDSGHELAFVKAVNPRHVWTEIDDGRPMTVAGLHFVNRNGYSITLEPWESEDEWSQDPDYPHGGEDVDDES
jgi:hypothetical protein